MDVSIRELTEGDAGDFGLLVTAIDRDHATPLRLSDEEFLEVNEMPGTRFYGAFADGTLVAWSGFLASVQPTCQRFLVDGDQDPSLPGAELAPRMMARALDEARAWHVDTEPDLPTLFVNRALVDRREHEQMVAAFGFVPERHRWMMVADLDDVPQPEPVPEDLTLTAFDPADSERLRAAHHEAYPDHASGATRDKDNWAGFMLAGHARHHLSFVLTDPADRVASYAFAHEYPVPSSGRDGERELYFPYVGTTPAHRGRGLASALVVQALRAAAAEGYTAACLDVDSAIVDGSPRRYERAGFRHHHTFVEYTLREQPPAETLEERLGDAAEG